MKYKLVQFSDGKFGARVWFFGYKYLDLETYDYAWRGSEHVHKYGKGTREQALAAIQVHSDQGTLV